MNLTATGISCVADSVRILFVHSAGESSFEMKIEADSNDITQCPHYDEPSISMLFF